MSKLLIFTAIEFSFTSHTLCARFSLIHAEKHRKRFSDSCKHREQNPEVDVEMRDFFFFEIFKMHILGSEWKLVISGIELRSFDYYNKAYFCMKSTQNKRRLLRTPRVHVSRQACTQDLKSNLPFMLIWCEVRRTCYQHFESSDLSWFELLCRYRPDNKTVLYYAPTLTWIYV